MVRPSLIVVHVFVLLEWLILTACTEAPMPTQMPTPWVTVAPFSTSIPSTAPPTTAAPAADVRWDVYYPDAQHLWNRLFRQFYERISREGRSYGRDTLDPLLWEQTQYLLDGASHAQAVRVLDEFLSIHGEDLIMDPLRRALLQHDLWAVFDWLSFRSDDHPSERRALQQRIAQVMRHVALTQSEILSLPDNYQAAVRSGAFLTDYRDPTTPFLPPDLLSPTGDWRCIGREGGPTAIMHVLAFPFVGRSAFLAFIRVPGGRNATVDFLRQMQDAHLRQKPMPEVQAGTEVALVRRMLLVDREGRLTPSPLVESVQVRHFEIGQVPFEFILSRDRLFAGQAGGLRALTLGDREFSVFMTHGIDWFEFQSVQPENGRVSVLATCDACHLAGSRGILSLSRERFPLPNNQPPKPTETTAERETQIILDVKLALPSWKTLEALWRAP